MPGPGPLTRRVHPVAWWAWAAGLATAASRTTDPTLLLLVIGVAVLTVSRREDPSAGRPLTAFLTLALVAVGLRVVLTALLGGRSGPTVLVDLPRLALPRPLDGLSLGGPVTLESLAGAVWGGLQLAAILVVTGCANALASPRRLLRHVPASLDDIGTTLVVALSLAPALVDDARRVRAGRRLRGRRGTGVREVGPLAVAVLDGALRRSLHLAASMEGRGYGRRPGRRSGATASGVAVVGLVAVVAGLYGLLDGSADSWFGLPLLAGGTVVAGASLAVGSRRDARTRYRPDPVGAPEALVVSLGLLPAAVLVLLSTDPVTTVALHPSTSPLVAPAPPLLAVTAVAAAGLVAVLTPPVPSVEAVAA